MNVEQYLSQLEAALAAGSATEHTHRPALKALIESCAPPLTATNEPKRIACGAPDFCVTQRGATLGYIEAKDVGRALDEAERSPQLTRYRRALDSLILTDYLEFRWYVAGAPRQQARLARVQSGGRLKPEKDGAAETADLLHNFLAHRPRGVSSPKELAERLARLTHVIRDIIVAAFETRQASRLLQGWRQAFARVLLAELNEPERTPEFADMFAQTLAYGLFTARVMDAAAAPSPNERGDSLLSGEGRGGVFSRHTAQYLIPKSNPFLRDFFTQITGPQLDDEPFASFVDDLVHLLAHTDMAAVLADFGRRTRQEDPVVHFYETFLAAYDPKLREARGVYYTPEPVVSYIVRSVDHLLKTRFDCPQGVADSRTIRIPNADPGKQVKGTNQMRKTEDCHKVLILDPAAGTGTFLYAVIDHIRRQFMQQGNAGLWPGYVKAHLLPRLFGFELLMAPYAVAHFKLSLQLAGRDLPAALADDWAYYPAADERVGVYLTNALEDAHEMTGLPLFTQWVADETNAANAVKQRLPVLVVMGNPPYSVSSSNNSPWITELMKSYKQAVRGERNIQPLSDDYIKFIRLAQDRIERTEQGIVGLITNHAYLSGLIHRGMRAELMQTFTTIYILNLHGNATVGELAPDGGKDENVFDIRQGAAIALFVKERHHSGQAEVKSCDLWGKREDKYDYLRSHDVETTEWQTLTPQEPYYFFVPKDFSLIREYESGWQVNDILPVNSGGIKTHRDHFVIDFDEHILQQRIAEFLDSTQTEQELKEKFNLKNTGSWQITKARIKLQSQSNVEAHVTKCVYRPFDIRAIFYSGDVIDRPRAEVMTHLLHDNLSLLTMRQVVAGDNQYTHFLATRYMIDNRTFFSSRGTPSLFPLYLYPSDDAARQKSLLDVSPWPPDAAHAGRVPNLNPQFIADLERRLGLTFRPNLTAGPHEGAFGPEEVFHYIYAVFHSPTYRTRYAEFLKIDFPRAPLTSDAALFWALCAVGRQLAALHLLEAPELGQVSMRYPAAGDNRVAKGYPKYIAPTGGQAGRVKINPTQYFEGVPPEVWEFRIGGYQPARKWLKDRRGRALTYDDLTHYQQVVVALRQTGALMARVDKLIPAWPVE